MWEPQIQALSAHFRVIAFDHRGHGDSPVPPTPYAIANLGADVVALLDHLGIERASYAGISIGGMAGIWLGANAPTRLDRLMLMCTSACYTAGPRAGSTARSRCARPARPT